jgi:hypothetical protein
MAGTTAEPEAARLLATDVAVTLEDAEHQICDHLGGHVWSEERLRDTLGRCKVTVDARPAGQLEDPVTLAWPVRETRLQSLALHLAAKRFRDRCSVLMQRWFLADERDRSFSTDVAIADQVAEHPRVLGRNRLRGSEAERATWASARSRAGSA